MPLALRHRSDEAWRGHHFEALVEADQKFRRYDLALDRAELHAFGLTRDRAQLACRIDFGLDAAAGIFFQRGGEILDESVDLIVDGRERYFHRVGFVLRLRRRQASALKTKRQTKHDPVPSAIAPPREAGHRILPFRRFAFRRAAASLVPNVTIQQFRGRRYLAV